MAVDMEYISRTMIYDNMQVLTTFDWEWEIITPANYASYIPDNNIIRVRSTSISGIECFPLYGGNLQIPLRGFTMIQPGKVETKPQPVTIQMQDFEDQALTVWIYDWLAKCSSPINVQSFRREEVQIGMNFYQLNTSRQRVSMYEYFGCLPQSNPSMGVQWSTDKQPIGNFSVTIEAEYMKWTPLNAG